VGWFWWWLRGNYYGSVRVESGILSEFFQKRRGWANEIRRGGGLSFQEGEFWIGVTWLRIIKVEWVKWVEWV